MREIKFRIIQKGDKPEDYTHLNICPLDEGVNASNLTIYKGDIVLQYTGLKDKNGTEIYEGDIVKGSMGRIGEVKFGEYVGSDYYDHPHTGRYYEICEEPYDLIQQDIDEITVVGNIYENPELLGE